MTTERLFALCERLMAYEDRLYDCLEMERAIDALESLLLTVGEPSMEDWLRANVEDADACDCGNLSCTGWHVE